MKPAVRAEAVNLTAVLESISLVSDIGAKAQRAAFRDTGKNARTRAVRKVTAKLSIAQKVLRKRIQVFIQRPKRDAVTVGRLWTGIARPPTAAAHPSVRVALARRHPSGILVRRPHYGNRVAWMTRNVATGKLFEERLVFDRGEIGRELEVGVRDAFTEVYPKRLRAQFLRLVKQKITGRPRGVRRRRKK